MWWLLAIPLHTPLYVPVTCVCSERPNILAQSKNGSGKTGAFGICLLNAIDPAIKGPQALCLSPTRELAMQTKKRLEVRNWGLFRGLLRGRTVSHACLACFATRDSRLYLWI